jgi:BRCA1 C Terminus (BRCT) domain
MYNLQHLIVHQIQRLGGILLESTGWHPECTHLVVGAESRSEKYLAAIAARVWYASVLFYSGRMMV